VSKNESQDISTGDEIERVIELLSSPRKLRARGPSPSSFRAVEPIVESVLDRFKESNSGQGWLLLDDTELRSPQAISEPLDISLLSGVYSGNKDSKPAPSEFGIRRIRTVSPREVRGRARPYRITYEITYGVTTHGLFATCPPIYYGRERSGELVYSGQESHYMAPGTGHQLGSDIRAIGLAMSLQIRRPYQWRVVLGREDWPSVSFSTDPDGAKEVFRLRDAPPGRTRRAALRNWVTEHWRQTRTASTKVQTHLRGVTKFTWNGLNCEIIPTSEPLSEIGIRQRMYERAGFSWDEITNRRPELLYENVGTIAHHGVKALHPELSIADGIDAILDHERRKAAPKPGAIECGWYDALPESVPGVATR